MKVHEGRVGSALVGDTSLHVLEHKEIKKLSR